MSKAKKPQIKNDILEAGVFPDELMPRVNSEMDRILAMRKLPFTCAACGKTIEIQADIFTKLYAGQTACLDCRKNHGHS